MILPSTPVTELTLEELIQALQDEIGYTPETASYIAGRLKGTIEDSDKPLI